MSTLVDQAEAALRAGQFSAAKAALEQALARGLDGGLRTEARSMLGLALTALGEISPALEHLRAAVAAEPGEAMFRYNLGRGLAAAGDFAAAVAEHREAVRLSPGMAPLEIALAQASMGAGQFADAQVILEKYAAHPQAPASIKRLLVQCLAGAGDTHAALDKARELVPADVTLADAQTRQDAMTAAGLAHAAMYYDEAEKITGALIARDPADAEAATILGQLRLWTRGPDAAAEVLQKARDAGASSPRILVDLMALTVGNDEDLERQAGALLDQPDLTAEARSDLLLALAQYYDRIGDADQAWDRAAQGKAAVPPMPSRDWRATLETQLNIYRSSQPVADHAQGPQHLYLLGTPRSGQSLLQSILAAAPDVASAGERGALLQHLLFRQDEIAAMSAGARASLLTDLAAADDRGLKRLLGTPQWVVDKSPLHLPVAGNVARVHPEARFACVLRDPADVAVSIWLRRFAPIYDYAQDFGAIVDQLEFALDSIAAWQAESVAIRLIDFAAFLEQPESQAQALFEWLGIAWSSAFLDPANRTEPVPTYSAAQVRQAVGAGSSAGATPYHSQLAPYADRLNKLRDRQASLMTQNTAR